MADLDRLPTQAGDPEANNQAGPGKVRRFIDRNRGKIGLVIGALLTHATWIAVLHTKATEEQQQTLAIPVGILICGEDAILGVRQCLTLPLEQLQREQEEGCPDIDNPLPSPPNPEELCPDIKFDGDTPAETPKAEEGQRI